MVTVNVTGAEAVVGAMAARGIDVCFANPGTTEMPLVAALDSTPGVRAVLGLQENVCTGAADGFARIGGRVPMTLLHLGPGLSNGLANLHNARRAHSPVVNVVGDHMSWHLPYDSPLTSDIAALAGTVGSVRTSRSRGALAAEAARSVDEAMEHRRVVTLVVPADHQQETGNDPELPPAVGLGAPAAVGSDRVKEAAEALRHAARRCVLLLGGNALTAAGQRAAGRIAAQHGAAVYCETFPARAERGGGLPAIDRLPYFPERAVAVLHDAETVVVIGTRPPLAYFGYRGMPSELARPGTVLQLAAPGEDAEAAVRELADLVAERGAEAPDVGRAPGRPLPEDEAPLTADGVAALVAGALPEGAVVSVEGGTLGYPFYAAGSRAARHTVLTNTGGAIGQGLPCALGAAIAAPDRQVIALQSDGSGLYTAQALWTMARERTDVVVLIAANHTYGVLRAELARHGQEQAGVQADALTRLDDPRLDWVSLAHGFGVGACRVARVGELRQAFEDALASPGPALIEVAL